MMRQTELIFEAARSRADAGIERVARKAERCDPAWLARAQKELAFFARGVTAEAAEFTIEQARDFVEALAPRPDGVDGRVWGAVTRQAVQAGIIERVPGRFREAASSNGSPKPVYRRGPNA